MHKFTLNVLVPAPDDREITDFGAAIELARQYAHALNRVVYLSMEGAGLGCPDRWAISPKGYVSIESVKPNVCLACGDN